MTARTAAPLTVGTKVAFDGQQWEVREVAADRVAIRARNGEARSVAVTELLSGGRLLVEQPPPTPAVGPILAGLDDAERRQLEERRAHVLEVLTGYRSGTPDRALPAEPRPEYAPRRRKQDRVRAKAVELHSSGRTVRRWLDDYRRLGDVGLVDWRRLRQSDPLAGIDDRWTEMAQRVLSEEVKASRRPRAVILDEITRRLKEEEPRLGVVPVPKRTTARAALAELTRGTNAFAGSTKGKRSIANRPPAPYGCLRAAWPGQYLLLDTTRLNVFAMERVTLRWVQVELSVALDLYSRSIVAVRLTPVSTKAVDAAGLLYEAICPDSKARLGGGVLPYLGVPATVVCDPDKTTDVLGLPDVVPDTIIVDHGKIYLSAHVAAPALGDRTRPRARG
jgi:hypothetical protein